MLQLAGDAQQRRNHEAVRQQDRDCRDDYRQGGERGQQGHCVALDRGEEVAGRDHCRDDPIAEIQR